MLFCIFLQNLQVIDSHVCYHILWFVVIKVSVNLFLRMLNIKSDSPDQQIVTWGKVNEYDWN